VLKLHPSLAPIKAAVLPLAKQTGNRPARKVNQTLFATILARRLR
jgi:glycyl-tRNA synthetase (class II)